MNRRLFGLLAVLLWLPAFAQNTITFTAETTTGVETVTPVLTWSTTPAANSCLASGSWSGEKGAAGTETFPPITKGATYNLTCTWFDGAATLSWEAPTENTDGSPLTDLAGYTLYWGTTSGDYPNSVAIDNPNVTTYVVEPLSAGIWYFVVTALNEVGVESDFSNEAQKVVSDSFEQESVGITVNPKPNAPTGLNAQ